MINFLNIIPGSTREQIRLMLPFKARPEDDQTRLRIDNAEFCGAMGEIECSFDAHHILRSATFRVWPTGNHTHCYPLNTTPEEYSNCVFDIMAKRMHDRTFGVLRHISEELVSIVLSADGKCEICRTLRNKKVFE